MNSGASRVSSSRRGSASTEAAARAKEAEAERAAKSRGRLAWLETRDLDSVRPIEFEHADSALSADARTLERVAAALKADPELKLHIAGHSQSSEDARVSSQRAQAVGAALISMGAAPARLRAKGYARDGVAARDAACQAHTDRNDGRARHPIGEVRATGSSLTRAPPLDADAYASASPTLPPSARRSRLRLSVEGHADARGDATDNARVAAARAAACCEHLKTLGVATTRLVAHGFGAALVGDNATAPAAAPTRRVNAR